MTPSPALPLSIPEIHQAIREAGGIVHSDGNIFFTRAEQFVVAGVLCDERSAAPSPALPREGQPGLPGQVQDHLVSPVPCLRQSVRCALEFHAATSTPTKPAGRGNPQAVLYNQCDGFHIVFARFYSDDGAFDGFYDWCGTDPYTPDFYSAWALLPDTKELHATFARRVQALTGADTESHGPNELTAESAPDKGPWEVNEWDERIVLQSDDFTHDVALIVDGDFGDHAEKLAYANRLAAHLNAASAPGESADPQSQGDTQ